jgi:hypothetical protein
LEAPHLLLAAYLYKPNSNDCKKITIATHPKCTSY